MCVPARATITFSCDATITAFVSCGTLNTTLNNIYGAAFTDAIAHIYVAGNTSGAVSLGESDHIITGISYSSYKAGLAANDPGSAGFSTLPGTDPYGTGNVQVTNSMLYALPSIGITPNTGVTGTNLGGSMAPNFTTCNPLGSNCYDGIILVNTSSSMYLRTGPPQTGSQFDFYSVLEHEADEVLGTSSCLARISGVTADECQNPTTINPTNNNVSAADLFRFTCSSISRNFGAGGNACFSVDGGATDLKQYNNIPNGQDFGDWSSTCANVQDAVGCAGKSFDIASGAEITLLNSVGFSLVTVPEPSALGMVGIALLGARVLRRRVQTRKNQ